MRRSVILMLCFVLVGFFAFAGIAGADPPSPQDADDYVETPSHIMVIVPKSLLEGVTDDPSGGGPYVMWKDTDYAHLMIPVNRD